jgi:hypothetical protein
MPPAPRLAGPLLGLLLAASPAAAQTRPTVLSLEAAPASALYLAESFFGICCQELDLLAVHVGALLRGSGSAIRLRAAPAVVNGQRLDQHDPMAFLRGRRAETTPAAHRPFDIALLEDCLACGTDSGAAAGFLARLRTEAEAARRQGAEPVLFMPWTTDPAAQARIAEATTQAANAAGAFVIPAGLAFARARTRRPDLELSYADPRIPTPAGTYLAAAITFAALYGRSPEGNAYRGGLDAATAGFLQRVAWQTAWDYFAGRAPPERP